MIVQGTWLLFNSETLLYELFILYELSIKEFLLTNESS